MYKQQTVTTGSYTIKSDVRSVFVAHGGGTATMNFPDPTKHKDRVIFITRFSSSDTGVITITTVLGTSVIENPATNVLGSSFTIASTILGLGYISDGIGWHVILNYNSAGGGNALTSNPLSQFAATTSAQLAGVISDETGTGSLVFATSPTLVTPVLGVATATSVNKLTITAPTTSATLTIVNGSSLITAGAFSTTLTSTASTNVTLPTTGTLATLAGTETFTNKRINPRVQTITSSATVTLNADTDDLLIVTAQAAGLTVAAPSGTPVQGQAAIYRFKDNGTARSITFNAIFRAIGVTLPTTTTLSKTLYISTIYNATDSKWDVLGIALEA